MSALKKPVQAMNLSGRFIRLGLAGRVVALACVAIVVATLVQCFALAYLMRNQTQAERVNAVDSAIATFSEIASIGVAHGSPEDYQRIVVTLADALPEGSAGIYGVDGLLLAYAGRGESAPALEQVLPALNEAVRSGGRYWRVAAIDHHGEPIGYTVYSYTPPSVLVLMADLAWRVALVLGLVVLVIAPFMLPLARGVLRPLVELEDRVRRRSAHDRSGLAAGEHDALLQPLLRAIDAAHEKSEATAARALRLAYSDPITRLPNRLHVMSKLDSLLSNRDAQPFYFAICDLDEFSKLNLTLGPRAADEALATVGKRLKACAKASWGNDVVLGRLGADQFAIIAVDKEPGQLVSMMEEAGDVVSDPMIAGDQKLIVSCSFGAAHAPDDATQPHDLIKKAEIALKEAKGSAGKSAVLYDDSLLAKARRRSQLEAEIRRGIDCGEFVAVFQPKVYLETGELAGAEALARWRRPDGAVVSPGVFIPIAEELGLISELGKAVLRDACFAASKWKTHGRAARIAVNVSPVQLEEPDFVQTVERILEESGLAPQQLELEITESSAVRDPDYVSRIMWPLRERGVHIAIDDFGTGHSNFATITRLPFDVFKIDQQFIRGLLTDPTAPTIVEMILAMAETMGQETVAEGIETAEQADFLLNRACTIGQGYYFSPPLPAEEFDVFIRSWRPPERMRSVA